jgi:hypothetical protein
LKSSRIALIPIAHVAAEVVAYPLVSEGGLRLAVTTLCPQLCGDTVQLWRSAEQDLLSTYPAVSLDEIVAIRDDTWFHDVHVERPLGEYLRCMAKRFFEVRGARAFPRLDLRMAGPPGPEGDGVARVFWRWLSFALPLDLFLAALGEGERFPREVQPISPLLDRRLSDGGFAETQVHLNGCFGFDSVWISTLREIAKSEFRLDAFASPGACLEEGKHLASWLLRAALARYVLTAFLEQRDGGSEVRIFLRDMVLDRVRRKLGPGAGATLVRALEDLREGRLSAIPFAAVQFLYSCMIDTVSGRPREAEEVWAYDPIAPLLSGIDGPPEIRFVAQGLRYLNEAPKDDLFARLFWQVVRVRCLFYRHLVQRPMTPGLQWFVRFFKRIKKARTLFGTHLKGRIAASLCGAEHGLRSLEVRSAPEPDISSTFTEILDFDEALRRRGEGGGAEAPFEFGIVWHFGRDREGGWFKGEPAAHWSGTAADPRVGGAGTGGNPTGYRYGHFYKKKRKEAQAAARVLTFFPRTLEIVRGLDLCTDEAGVPTWVMAPLVRYVRDAGRNASAALRERLGLEVSPLHMTVHAGEDFVHLLSGLRRLDEAIDHFVLGEGDRLGHALSLGVDPKKWAERAGRVAIPREERLLDLAWEWAWYARFGGGASGGRQALLQNEIADHSHRIFGIELTPWQVGQLVQDLHEEEALLSLGFPDRPYSRPTGERWSRAHTYLMDPEVFSRGREILWIDPSGEVEAIQFLQKKLREKVGRMGLTIEVNPSSNLLIGHLSEIGHHPLWNLCPPVERGDLPPLSVCIGSDDPLTFATTLREEYQLLYDALIFDGNSESVAHAWLERARSAGLSARFTLPETRRVWDERRPEPGLRDPRREALTFSPLAWTSKLDLPP